MRSAALLDLPMAKEEKAKGRFEFKAPQSWITRAEKMAEKLGMSLAASSRSR